MFEILDQAEPKVAEMRKGIITALGQQVSSRADRPWEDFSSEIGELCETLEKANAWRAHDPQDAVFLKLSCALLSTYRVLEPLFDEKQDLLDIMRSVLEKVYYVDGVDAYLERRFGVKASEPDNAWQQVSDNMKKGGEEQFGKSWAYEQGIKDHKRCFVNIRKCGFADFFLGNDAREILYVLCALDYIWADALLEKYGIRLERPTIIAEGSDICRFQFFNI